MTGGHYKPRRRAVSKPGKELLIEMLRRRPLLERIVPVLELIQCSITGDPTISSTARQLPVYCHKIVTLFRRTYFKVVSTPAEIITTDTTRQPTGTIADGEKPTVAVNWRRMGRTLGVGLRTIRFGLLEADGCLNLRELESLRMDDGRLVAELIVGPRRLKSSAFKLAVAGSGVVGEGPRGKALKEWNADLTGKKTRLDDTAYQQGVVPMKDLYAGMAEGFDGFIDEDGRLAGEPGRANNYWFLLLCWPEIQEMQALVPPISRNDFWAWFEPFAKAGFVNFPGETQLMDVCDDIGLRFKGRGAPKKMRQLPTA